MPLSTLQPPLLFLLAFLLGALPFSVWVGRAALHTDIRQYGDHNPGATNVLRAGGWRWGGLAMLLDCLKAAIPVGLAHFGLGWEGWPLALIAIAPVAGHAFSPFLRLRGGKAVAATFGAWVGLTVWEGPTVLGLLLGLSFALIAASGWAVILAFLGLLAYFLLLPASFNPLDLRPALFPTLLIAWLGHFAILIWKHRAELAHWPRLRGR
jgi:glycerol-3-phosphate acyltransferase PlsY